MDEIKKAIKYLKESKCDQKQGESYQEYHNEMLNIAIQALEKQLNNKWIPVSERLPEPYMEVQDV